MVPDAVLAQELARGMRPRTRQHGSHSFSAGGRPGHVPGAYGPADFRVEHEGGNLIVLLAHRVLDEHIGLALGRHRHPGHPPQQDDLHPVATGSLEGKAIRAPEQGGRP